MTLPAMIQGPTGQLEVLSACPRDQAPRAVAVICHPHPLQEGTLHNKVVTTLHKSAEACGAATWRFNFRGVGRSDGVFDDAVGECDDLRAVLAAARLQYPDLPVWLMGFSFGAYVAARVAHDDQSAACLVTIAPAIAHYDFEHLSQLTCPWLVLHGDQDEVAPYEPVAAWAQQPPAPLTLITMPDADHFFHGRLIELREQVIAWLNGL